MSFFDRRPSGDLDHMLASWSDSDPWTVRDACANTLIVGKTGSGAGDHCLRAVVRYPNSGGVIFAAKPEDKAYVQRVMREERTLADLYVFEPGGDARFNVLDYERERGADVADLTQAVMTFQETLNRTQGEGGGGRGGGDDAGYWAAQQRMMLYNAIQVVLLATGRIDPWAIQCFISGAAISLAELNDAKWLESYHYQMLQEAKAKARGGLQQHDFELAHQYWTFQLPRMNDRTRTSIEAGVYMTLHAMNTGIARELLATTTNLSPELLEQRKWILVNCPIAPGDVTSAVINSAFKYAVQRHIIKRQARPGDPLICIFSDEFQKLANSYDALFLAECRSHKGGMIALTQSVHALYANLHGKGGEHQTDALLTNFSHVVVHTLGDAKSAKLWSEMLGQRREVFIGTSLQPDGEDLFSLIIGQSRVSVNAQERWEPALQPSVFLRGLRQGGPANDNIVDGVVIRSGQPFNASGENYLITRFRQR
jgi:type IV secretory pathway TraG/TraD family ATPase VirD4